MNKGFRDEEGLTLVEVLAALVLLGIVFVSFMMVFPQMTSFNAKTESKLETMNLARKELDIVRSFPPPEGFIQEINKIGKMDVWTNRYPSTDDKYIVEVNYDTQPDLTPESGEAGVSLYRVSISIFKAEKKVSETMGYIELET